MMHTPLPQQNLEKRWPTLVSSFDLQGAFFGTYALDACEIPFILYDDVCDTVSRAGTGVQDTYWSLRCGRSVLASG
jgi:hypothetical protein